MKFTTRFFLALLMLITMELYSQTPFGVSYQAVIRNPTGQAIVDQNVVLKIMLVSGADNAYYTEHHYTKTNAFGMVNVILGSGTEATGSYANVPWSNADIHLKVEFKKVGEASFTSFEKQKLQAVPYALYAADGLTLQWQGSLATPPSSPKKNYAYYNTIDKISYIYDGDSWEILAKDGVMATGTAGQTLSHNGASWVANGTIMVTDSSVNIVPKAGHDPAKPIFSVLNSSGQVVFAVYESGVRSFVGSDNTGSKGAKGGFAIGGLSTQGKGTVEYMRIVPDSTRFYVEEPSTTGPKGAKGGFAIGGLSTQGKAGTVQYFRLDADSAIINIDDSDAKGAKGGFAIGGRSTQGKGASKNYFEVTKDSTYFTNTILSTGNMLVAGTVETNVGIAENILIDVDGNKYKTVKIGTQVWMAENLNTTKYATGKVIGQDTLVVYNNSSDLDTITNYGRLYSAKAIESGFNVCPDGWRVPSPADWQMLFSFVGGPQWMMNSTDVFNKLAETGTIGEGTGFWNSNLFQNNVTGFSVRPSGDGVFSGSWMFNGMGNQAKFWTSAVPSIIFFEGVSMNGMVNTGEGAAEGAYSVRCVKN